jgi:hypothetical protein
VGSGEPDLELGDGSGALQRLVRNWAKRSCSTRPARMNRDRATSNLRQAAKPWSGMGKIKLSTTRREHWHPRRRREHPHGTWQR